MNNLLSKALSVIPQSIFTVENFLSRTANDYGIYVNTYDEPVTATGIIQAVENSAYQTLGLEFGKYYVQVWSLTTLRGIDKQEVADRIIYNSQTFNVIKSVDWMTYNGWNSVIAVEEKADV